MYVTTEAPPEDGANTLQLGGPTMTFYMNRPLFYASYIELNLLFKIYPQTGWKALYESQCVSVQWLVIF